MSRWKIACLNFISLIFRVVRILTPLGKIIIRAYYLSGLRQVSSGSIPASTQLDGAVYLLGSGNLDLGEYCRIGRNVVFETDGNAKIVIGNRVRINDGSIIGAHAGIVIGDDAMIGEYVSIRDANHGTELGALIREQKHQSASISIGKDVWIGRGSCVLKGVIIGDGAVIGANSVVTRSVSEGVICAGAPVRQLAVRLS